MAGDVMVDLERAGLLVEALVFASPEPVRETVLVDFLRSQGFEIPVEDVLSGVVASYEGRAVELVSVAGGWQFRTRAEFAPALVKVIEKPRRLSRGAMETLAVIAYHQPCTRAEIEAIRGVSLNQSILDTLLEDGLVGPKGRKEVPGRPVLWGTTTAFLEGFGLEGLSSLPRREDFLLERALTEEQPVGAQGETG